MMIWQRASMAFTCGFCGDVRPKGDPMLVIRIDGVRGSKRRCEKCAGEPVPEDIPVQTDKLVVPTWGQSVEPMTHITAVRPDLTARLVGSE